MHYDASEGKTRIELARRQDGKAARVKLGLFANVAETIDLRGSADRLAILTVLSCLTEATSRRAGVELPQYVDRILKGAKPAEFRSSSPRSSIW